MDSVLYHFLFLIIVLPISSLAQTNGTIPVGTSLTATQNSTPWLSPSADFAFGFQFLPQNGQFLLCIWYHNLPEKTIVWYANEGNIVPTDSKLELNAQNGLVLTDPQGTQLWSSNPASTTIDHGFINDTGNFILVGTDSSSLWESFGNPTDTLLPTQTMEINGVLNSRVSDTNFSRGRFQFRLLEDGNAVLNPRDVLSNFAYEAYYRSDTSNSSNSSNSGRQLVFNETGHMLIIRGNGEISELMAQLVTPSGDYYYRATLNFDGVFSVYSRQKIPDGDQNWTSIWSKPDNICINILAGLGSGACGYNSVCRLGNNSRPVCECPLGYSLLDPNDTHGSCKPNFVQSCDENELNSGKDLYGIEEMSNTNWPLHDYERQSPLSEADCRNSCLTDCFCAVAVYGISNTCWKKKLPLSNGRRDPNSKSFIKFRKGDSPGEGHDSSNQIPGMRTKRHTFTLVGFMLLGSSVFVNFVLLIVGYFCFSPVYKKKVAKPIGEIYNILETNLRGFSYEELVEATNGFKDELGRGAFGIVYKGVIDMGGSRCNVAIKKLDGIVRDGEKEFRAEVNAIAHTHHKNLVRLLGFCDDGENRLLVYEYMSNGTLASFLFGDTRPCWNQRSRISLGIVRGLLYLHEECTTQIIHCDIKPQNVLLDDYYNARISDFGLAKLLMVEQSRAYTAIRGTKGYVAPEWFRNTPVTVKVDVYSFGVLLLEIVSCRRSFEFLNVGGGEREILTDWVWDCFQEGKLEALVENDVEALNDMKILERFVMVGIWCIQEDPFLRPSMRKVSQMLEGVVEVTPPPCPFLFSTITMGIEEIVTEK